MVEKFSSTVSVNRPLKRIHIGQQEGYQREEFYEDTGCEVSTKCLECQLSQCKLDDPDWYYETRRFLRDTARYNYMQDNGLSTEQAAEKLGITSRTMFRIARRIQTRTVDATSLDIEILSKIDAVN